MPNDDQQMQQILAGMSQGGQPQGGQPQPQGGQPQGGSFDPNQNPFEKIMQQSQQPQQPEGTPVASQPGKTGDNSKFLLSALQNLYNFVGSETNMETISAVRTLIRIISQIFERDQAMAEEQPRMIEQEQQPQQPQQ